MAFGILTRLEGPQTLGRGPAFWGGFLLVLAAACAYPLFADGYTVGNPVYFFTWVFMALGLSVIWGYCGALSFGQTAFFGIAGYGYGILTINFGSAYGFTLIALVIAVALACLFAALLGYFLFYGRIAG
ncbi:ABC transporter permease, partial [Staphylococcus schleiferi subsp. coagulans]|nr:ABC transporter permease [Staphylococcus coagulans]